MKILLHNSGLEPLYIKVCSEEKIIHSGECHAFTVVKDKATMTIKHIKNDRFNSFWYVLNEIFTLEQMRTVLVVDGEYELSAFKDGDMISVKSYEYVFHKNMSYQTAVFSTDGAVVTRKSLCVAHSEQIFRRARILYLFGGSKTLLPLSFIPLVATLLEAAVNGFDYENILLSVVLLAFFLFSFTRYFKSLKELKISIDQKNILAYFSSERKQYRNFIDNLPSNENDRGYW